MASFSSNKNNNVVSPSSSLEPATTFVHADPSTFRSVVQRLTGGGPTSLSPHHHHHHHLDVDRKPPFNNHNNNSSSDLGRPRNRPAFKLHERRQINSRNLEIKLNNNGSCWSGSAPAVIRHMTNSSFLNGHFGNGNGEIVVASPVSTLDVFARGSPRTPASITSPVPVPMATAVVKEEEEEKAIAAKGFYLHPISPITTTPKGSKPPQLLTLFPLHSPNSSSSSSLMN